MSSETVEELPDEQDTDVTSEDPNPSVFKLRRWQWVTIFALALGQSFTQAAYTLAEVAGAFVGAAIMLFLFAVLFRFVGSKIGWEDSHGVFAKVSVLASVLSMPVGILLIPPVAVYLLLLLVIYVPLQLLILGGGFLLASRDSEAT